MSSPEWILAVGRLKLFLYLEESPGLSLVVDPVEAGEGDVFLVPEVGRLKEGIKVRRPLDSHKFATDCSF